LSVFLFNIILTILIVPLNPTSPIHLLNQNSVFWFLQSIAMSKKQRSSIPKEECDRVSSLPDSIICHILSFLPTKDTVATIILSKRWKPLWLSVVTLDFIDYTPTFLDRVPLCCLIYSVMLLRDNNLPIRSFASCVVLNTTNPTISTNS